MKHRISRIVLAAAAATAGVFLSACGLFRSPADNVFDSAEEAIAAQIRAIRDGDVTDEELLAAKKSLISGYREIEDSAAAIAFWYENRRAAGIDTSPEETAAQVNACTKEALARCAAALTQDTLYFLRGTCADGGGEEDWDDDTD